MMLSEQATRDACQREHQEILRCCMEWDRQGACPAALEADLTHHSVVLYILRDYLAWEYHRTLHSG